MRKISNYMKVKLLLSSLGVDISKPLFHSTSLNNFKSIAKGGLRARAGGPGNDAYDDNAVCFSRNLDFLLNVNFFGSGQVILVYDYKELRTKFKSYPIDYYSGTTKSDLTGKHDPYEFEERFSNTPYTMEKSEGDEFCIRETVIPPKYLKAIIVKSAFWDKNPYFFINTGLPVILREGLSYWLPEVHSDYDDTSLLSADKPGHGEKIKKLFSKSSLSQKELETLKQFYLKFPDEGLRYAAKFSLDKALLDFVFDDFLDNSKFFLRSTGDRFSNLREGEVEKILNLFLEKGVLSRDNLEKVYFKYIEPKLKEGESESLLDKFVLNKELPLSIVENIVEGYKDPHDFFSSTVDDLSLIKDKKHRDKLVTYYLDHLTSDPSLGLGSLADYAEYFTLEQLDYVLDLFIEREDFQMLYADYNFMYLFGTVVSNKFTTYLIDKIVSVGLALDNYYVFKLIARLVNSKSSLNIKRPNMTKLFKKIKESKDRYGDFSYNYEETLYNYLLSKLKRNN